MRCLACNAILTDYEATLKEATTGKYVNECVECIQGSTANYALAERLDLKTVHDLGIDVVDLEID
mgnify:CR=1 FL=1